MASDTREYDADLNALGSLAPLFRRLAKDAETDAWLEAHALPHGALRTFLVERLSRFMSSYDAHGLTGSYAMHLLSTEQWRSLIGDGHGRLLDVGAGAGYVTSYAKPLFREIECTETSRRLAKRLRARGFTVHTLDLADAALPSTSAFDVISCLNVLDRTSHPRRLLTKIVEMCGPETLVLLAVPLPISAHVHVRGATITPEERLPSGAQTWEGAALELSDFLREVGLSIVSLSRAPYLSQGDRYSSRYVLDDSLWVLKRRKG